MKVYSLVNDVSNCGMQVEHGLSLYIIVNDGTKILFDMGQTNLFAKNAQKMAIDIADIDIAIISHGHYDHGGGLKTFLELNTKAKVYVHQNAFQPHYSQKADGLKYIGLNPELEKSNRIVFCDSQCTISKNVSLFSNVRAELHVPRGNTLLFGPNKVTNDDFCHEQHLVIQEGNNTFLFAGCAHSGIVNILNQMELAPTYVFAGMHFINGGHSEEGEDEYIEVVCKELRKFEKTRFYTMHCTGHEVFKKMQNYMSESIIYFSCGEQIEL